jgi:hypothetical protein
MALEFTQPLTETITRNIPGNKAQRKLKADNLTANCEVTVRKCGILDVSQTYRSPWPVTALALLFTSYDINLRVPGSVPQSRWRRAGINNAEKFGTC